MKHFLQYKLLVGFFLSALIINAQTFSEITTSFDQNGNNGIVSWGDYNNDGFEDALVSGWNGSAYQTELYANNQNGTFTKVTTANIVPLGQGSSEWGDYNNDNFPDIAIMGWDGTTRHTKIYKNNGDGTFTDIAAPLENLSGGEVAWGDYNNDTYLDLIIMGSNGVGASTKLYTNNHATTPDDFSNIAVGITNLQAGGVAWGFINGDSFLDIAITGQTVGNSYHTQVWTGDGSGGFSSYPLGGALGLFYSDLDIGDADNDGDNDIIVAGTNWTSGSNWPVYVDLYTNTGAGGGYTLSRTQIFGQFQGAGHSGSIEFGDYDNDNDLDAVLVGHWQSPSSGGSEFNVFTNNGSNSFTNYHVTNLYSGEATWGDYDNDTYLDILVAGTAGVKLYRNGFLPPYTSATNLSPNTATPVSNNLTLTWDASIGGTAPYSYQVNIYSGVTLIHSSASLTVTSYSIPNGVLSEATTYTWEVVTTDSETPTANTITSSTATFTTADLIALQLPINSITGQSTLPRFVWDEESGVTAYTLKLGTVSGVYTISIPLTVGVDATDLGSTIEYFANGDLADFPLTNNTWYYWTVEYVHPTAGTVDAPESYFKTLSNLSLTLALPIAESDVFTYDPLSFYWIIDQVNGSLRYKLELMESLVIPTSWATPTFSFDNISSLNKTVTGLTGDTKYYWRVVAYFDDGTTSGSFDNNDRVVKTSSVNYFTTGGGAVETFPLWPVNDVLVYNKRPSLYFYTLAYEPTAQFNIHISKTNDADLRDNGDVITVGPTTNLYNQVNVDLDGASDYYWQVETIYNATSKLSTVASFKTNSWSAATALAPTMSYPTGGVDVYTTSPYLYWYVLGASTDLRFEVEYREFGGASVLVDEINGLYHQLTNLTAGKTYEWRVQSYENGNKAGNNSGFPATWESFTVVGGGLTNTVASYPTNNPTVFTNDVSVYWYLEGSSLGFSNYTVKLYKGNATPAGGWASYSSAEDVTVNNVLATSHTFTGLENGATYYWAVAFNGGTYSEGSFTVVGGSSVSIVPTTPANQSIVYTSDVALYWYVSGVATGIQGYKVEYSNTSNFTSGFVTEVTSTVTNKTITGLLAGTTYYWKVFFTYENPATATTWLGGGTVSEFTLNAGASSVVPKVGSPINGVTLSQNSPSLSWRLPVASESQLVYDIQIADNKEFENAQLLEGITNARTEIDQLAKGEYFWRVRSRVKGNTSSDASNYSDFGNFKIDNVTAIAGDESIIPTEFLMEQNYPNPFNPSTVISYSLPNAQFVTLRVYNMLGQEIATLISEELNAGVYNVSWNGIDNSGVKASSGTYIYRIVAGSNSISKKMLLIK